MLNVVQRSTGLVHKDFHVVEATSDLRNRTTLHSPPGRGVLRAHHGRKDISAQSACHWQWIPMCQTRNLDGPPALPADGDGLQLNCDALRQIDMVSLSSRSIVFVGERGDPGIVDETPVIGPRDVHRDKAHLIPGSPRLLE